MTEVQRRYKENNRELLRSKSAEYRATNIEKVRAYKKAYREKNRAKINSYEKQRRNSDSTYRMLTNMRTRLSKVLKTHKGVKKDSTMDLLGCTLEQFKEHISSQFTDGMTLENYGEWHIDHIRPCASYNLSNENDQKECFHYSNLQPLWAEDNIRKSDKW